MDLRDRLQKTLGDSYTIERELGGGGMSRVFVAEDTRLGRRVVVKLLSPELAEGISAERFEREIGVAAKLQHPHIVPLLAAGDVNGLPYYTMPFVDGASLRARLAREGELSVGEAVSVLEDIARALAYAHGMGVVHRDIKPENILLSHGSAVVTDFGIAKAISASATASTSTGTTPLTLLGIALGSPAYMAPEQASADPLVDHRADLYALGCVAYELLSGQSPFAGRPTSAVLSAQVSEVPESIAKRRPNTPPSLVALVMQCLEKRPADRPASAADVIRALESVVITPSEMTAVGGGQRELPAPARPSAMNLAALGLAFALVVAVAIDAWVRARPIAPPPAQQSRFTLALGDSARFRSELGAGLLALSPDGSEVAYVGGNPQRLYLRSLKELNPKPLQGTELARSPQFSPDGKWLAFTIGTSLKKLSLSGGPVATITDSSLSVFTWGDGDVVLLRRPGSTGLWRVSAAGGPLTPVTHPDSALGETAHSFPSFLPGGKAAVFGVVRGGTKPSELAVVRLDDGTIVHLGVDGLDARFVSSGHLVFSRADGSLLAVPFDPRSLRVTGPVVVVQDNVSVSPAGFTHISVSSNGTMVYAPGNWTAAQLMLVDRQGRSQPLRQDPQAYSHPRFSPDGKRLAVAIGATSPNSDIWVEDLASGTLTRFTHDGKSSQPEWTADGRRIAWWFNDGKGGEIRWQPSDGSGAAEPLAASERTAVMSPSGGFFVTQVGFGGNLDKVALDSTHRRTPLVRAATSNAASSARISPDGRWLAYASSESGRTEVYVRPIAGAGEHHQISTQTGSEPVWGPSGRELFYRVNGQLLVATLTTVPEFAVVRRDTLFADRYLNTNTIAPDYDVSRDGKRFVMVQATGGDPAPVVVFGWLDELRERMRAASKR